MKKSRNWLALLFLVPNLTFHLDWFSGGRSAAANISMFLSVISLPLPRRYHPLLWHLLTCLLAKLCREDLWG